MSNQWLKQKNQRDRLRSGLANPQAHHLPSYPHSAQVQISSLGSSQPFITQGREWKLRMWLADSSAFPVQNLLFQVCLGFWILHMPGCPFPAFISFPSLLWLFNKHLYQVYQIYSHYSSALHRLAHFILS